MKSDSKRRAKAPKKRPASKRAPGKTNPKAPAAFKAQLTVDEPTGSPKAYLILGNGAGANNKHPFMRRFAEGLCRRGITVITFNFPYQEAKRKVPDKNAVLEACWHDVISQTSRRFKIPESDIAIGGKSMGGRIATQVAGQVKSQRIVLLGYPLHAPGKSDQLRDKHLYPLNAQMLFLWGEKDPFCLKPQFDRVRRKLKQARIYAIPNAGHSLDVPKKSGIDQNQLYEDCMDRIVEFLTG